MIILTVCVSMSAKKRKYLKVNKGLRHFSMKVCQKVEEKNVTSYNEVADELVKEFVTLRPNDAVRHTRRYCVSEPLTDIVWHHYLRSTMRRIFAGVSTTH